MFRADISVELIGLPVNASTCYLSVMSVDWPFGIRVEKTHYPVFCHLLNVFAIIVVHMGMYIF